MSPFFDSGISSIKAWVISWLIFNITLISVSQRYYHINYQKILSISTTYQWKLQYSNKGDMLISPVYDTISIQDKIVIVQLWLTTAKRKSSTENRICTTTVHNTFTRDNLQWAKHTVNRMFLFTTEKNCFIIKSSSLVNKQLIEIPDKPIRATFF